MEHDEMNHETTAASAQAESGSAPPVADPPAPPVEDAGPGLAGQVAAGLALIVLGGALLALERLDGAHEHLFLILVGGVFAAATSTRRRTDS